MHTRDDQQRPSTMEDMERQIAEGMMIDQQVDRSTGVSSSGLYVGLRRSTSTGT